MKSPRLTAVAAALVAIVVAGCGSAVTGSGTTGGAGSTNPSASDDTSAPTGPSAIPSSTVPPTTSSTSSGSVKPVVAFKQLTGNTSSVVLSSEFVSALTTLRVKPGVVGNTRVNGEQLMLPVTGGNVTVYERGQVDPYVQGELEHKGSGISLTAGRTTIELTDLRVRFGASPSVSGEATVNGSSVGTGIPLFDLDITSLRQPTLSQPDELELSGTQILFSSTLASALNDVFQTSVWKRGTVVGTLSSDLTGTT